MGGISGYSPSSGGSALSIQNDTGWVMKNGLQVYATGPVPVPPFYLDNADGVAGAPVMRIAPSWFPAAGPIQIDGTVTTEIPITVKGADDFIWDSCVISGASKVPDAGFRYTVWTAPGSTGTNIIPARALAVTDSHSVDEYIFSPKIRMRPDSMYFKVTVANATAFRFWIMFFGRVYTPIYT